MIRFLIKKRWLVGFIITFVWIIGPGQVLAADQALIEAAKKEGKFVWYTSMPMDAAVDYLKAFSEKYPFLDTSEFFRSTSYKVVSRLNIETEAEKHICDVAHIALVLPYLEWRQKGWLMKYDSPSYNGYPDSIKDPGYWAPMRTFATVMAYNTSVLKGDMIPKRWADLADSRFKGAIGVEGSDAGAQHVQYYHLRNILGEGFWKKIVANEPRVYGGSGANITALLRGETKVAMLSYGYAVYRFRELDSAPIQGVWPEEGVPINIGPSSIMAKAQHPNAAKLFMDWSLSQEGQAKMVKLVGAYSGRSDVSSAKGNPKWGTFKPLYIDDWDKFKATTGDFKNVWKAVQR